MTFTLTLPDWVSNLALYTLILFVFVTAWVRTVSCLCWIWKQRKIFGFLRLWMTLKSDRAEDWVAYRFLQAADILREEKPELYRRVQEIFCVREVADLRQWLDTLTITGKNIGEIRRGLFTPYDSDWNQIVRDETAIREVSPLPAECDPTTRPAIAFETGDGPELS